MREHFEIFNANYRWRLEFLTPRGWVDKFDNILKVGVNLIVLKIQRRIESFDFLIIAFHRAKPCNFVKSRSRGWERVVMAHAEQNVKIVIVVPRSRFLFRSTQKKFILAYLIVPRT